MIVGTVLTYACIDPMDGCLCDDLNECEAIFNSILQFCNCVNNACVDP